MPLTMAPVGQEFAINRISGKDETKKFLASLGFVVGSQVTIISQLGGNMILKVKDARVALDKTMANRIYV